jgi:hypothetical protein
MDIANLPSDNPFKFLFFAGVLVVFYTATFRAKETKSLEQDTENLSMEIEKNKYLSEAIQKETDYLIEDMNQFTKDAEIDLAKIKKSKNLGPGFEHYRQYMNNRKDDFDKKSDELNKRKIEKDISGIEANAKIKLYNKRLPELESFKKTSLLYYSVGLILAIFGFVMWFKEARMVSKMLKIQYRKAIKDDPVDHK